MTKKEIISEYPLSDDGNLKRFTDRFGDVIRYCPEANEWIVFENGQWKIDDQSSGVMRLASRTAADIHKDASEAEDQKDRVALKRWATKSGMYRRIENMVKLAKRERSLIISFDELKEMASDYWRIEWREHTTYWRRKLNLPRNE